MAGPRFANRTHRGYGCGSTTKRASVAVSERERRRLDLLVDEASMLSFPASDPPAVFLEERERRAPITNDGDETGEHAQIEPDQV